MYEVETGCTDPFGRACFIHYSWISYNGRKKGCKRFPKALSLHVTTLEMESLIISRGTEMLCVPVDRLVYISSDGNYSTVVTQDNHKQTVSYQLGQIEDIIDEQLGDAGSRFTRVGRGLIVNVDFVYFIDISMQRLVLSDCLNCFFDLNASREVLIKLKAYKEALKKYGK